MPPPVVARAPADPPAAAAHQPRRITITRPAVITKAVAQKPAVLTKVIPKEGVRPAAPPKPPAGSAVDPKREHFEERVSPAAPAPPLDHAIRLPEEVVLRLLDTGQPAFLRCWARAQREDPSLLTAKITVHLELDANGAVQRITTDAAVGTFGNCISAVSSHLPFPAPGRAAIVEFPLLFR